MALHYSASISVNGVSIWWVVSLIRMYAHPALAELSYFTYLTTALKASHSGSV
jgi:hypothetical protein